MFNRKLLNPSALLMALVAASAGHPAKPIVAKSGVSARNQRRLAKKR